MGGEIDDQREAEDRRQPDRQAGEPGGHRRFDDGDAEQHQEPHQPADGQVAVADVPAVEMQVGVGEDDEGGGKEHLRAGAPDLVLAGQDVDHPVPEAEVDAEIDQHRPCQRCGRREHRRTLDDEDDRQEQREQAGDAEHDAAVERIAVHRVLVGIGVPQIELRQRVGAKLGDEGDHRAGIEGDAEDIRFLAVLPVGREALARSDVGDARGAEVGPEDAGSREPEMGRDQQPVDLLVAVVGEGEDRPVGAAAGRLLSPDLDPPDDAVWAGSGRNLDTVVGLVEELDHAREIERPAVERHADRLQRTGSRHGQRRRDDGEEQDGDQTHMGQTSLRRWGDSPISKCTLRTKQGSRRRHVRGSSRTRP